MSTYKPGDPVWVRPAVTSCKGFPFAVLTCPISKETPAVVTRVVKGEYLCGTCKSVTYYTLDVVPSYAVCGCILRPRRDDYQQHEGLGSRDQLDKPITAPEERSLELGYILQPTSKEPVDA